MKKLYGVVGGVILPLMLYSADNGSAVSVLGAPTGTINSTQNSAVKIYVKNDNQFDPLTKYTDFNYSLDAGTTWSVGSKTDGNTSVIGSFVLTSITTDGAKTIKVKAFTSDASDVNGSQITTVASYTLDTIMPANPLILNIYPFDLDNNYTITDVNSSDINISVATDYNGNGIKNFKYKIDGGAVSKDFNATEHNITLLDLADGKHTLYIYASDIVDNWQGDANATEVNITIDSSAPKISTIYYKPFYIGDTISAKIYFDENISDLNFTVNDVPQTNFTVTDGNSSIVDFNYSAPSSGEYNITFRAYDLLGNMSDDTNYTIRTYALANPMVPKLYGTIPETNTSLSSFTMYPSGDRVKTYKYKVNNSQVTSAYTKGTALTLSGYNTDSWEYNLTVAYYDEDGNESNITTTWVTKTAQVLPTISSNRSYLTTYSDATFTITDSGSNNYTYSIDGDNNGSFTGTYVLSVSNLAEGDHNLTIFNSDNNQTQYRWRVDTTAINSYGIYVKEAKIPRDAITKNTSITLSVGGTDATAYKYSENGGTYSSEIAIDTNTTLTGFGASKYYATTTYNSLPNFNSSASTTASLYTQRISFILKDSVGNWTSENDAYVFGFYVDLVAPTFSLTQTFSDDNLTVVQIKGTTDDARAYFYKLDTSSYSKKLLLDSNLEGNITLPKLASGSHSLYVVAQDIAENNSSATTFTFTKVYGSSKTVVLSYLTTRPGDLPNIANVGYVNYSVAFDVNDTATSYSWTFGDGTTSTSKNPTKTYTADGTYSVSVTLTYSDGQQSTNTQTITINSVTTTSSSSSTATVSSSSTAASSSVVASSSSSTSSVSSSSSSSSVVSSSSSSSVSAIYECDPNGALPNFGGGVGGSCNSDLTLASQTVQNVTTYTLTDILGQTTKVEVPNSATVKHYSDGSKKITYSDTAITVNEDSTFTLQDSKTTFNSLVPNSTLKLSSFGEVVYETPVGVYLGSGSKAIINKTADGFIASSIVVTSNGIESIKKFPKIPHQSIMTVSQILGKTKVSVDVAIPPTGISY